MLKKIVCFLSLSITVLLGYGQSTVPVALLSDLLDDSEKYVNGDVGPYRHTTIVNKRPSFSWAMSGYPGNFYQKAYRILLADDPALLEKDIGNFWDSQKVPAASSAGIIYNGKELLPGRRYYWKVKVWDQENRETAYSAPASFFADAVLKDFGVSVYPLLKADQAPVTVKAIRAGYFVDFGKAAFGTVRLQLRADNEGDTIKIHLGEMLAADGRINRSPGGTIRYQVYDLPLKKGVHEYEVKIRPDKRNTGPQAVLMPDYTGEVVPFRYCEIEGYRKEFNKTAVTRIAVNYPFNDAAASFYSSDSVLNIIWELSKYSIKATTFAGIYVDGDRERIPYEADAYINQLGHYATDREFSMARRSLEYLLFHATWPTEWILQNVLMAWNEYLYTGDSRYLKQYYDILKKKLLTELEEANGLISTRTGRQTPELLSAIHFKGNELRDIVDWPHTGILGLEKEKGGETDGFVFTNYNAVVNAYYYKALTAMRQIALALKQTADAAAYEKRIARTGAAFKKTFWDAARKIYRDGDTTQHASLHANMFALAFGLVDDAHRGAVLSFIRSRGMACSVYGSQFLMDAVYEGGDNGAYGLQLLTSEADRSWYNMHRAGSTITMEAWDNKYKPNQDWNHAWGAAPANIIPGKLMGIAPLLPGWTRFRIRPQIGTLANAAIQVPTIKGTIHAAYEQSEKQFTMKLRIPANTDALIMLPVANPAAVFVNGKKVRSVTRLGSGEYEIKVFKK